MRTTTTTTRNNNSSRRTTAAAAAAAQVVTQARMASDAVVAIQVRVADDATTTTTNRTTATTIPPVTNTTTTTTRIACHVVQLERSGGSIVQTVATGDVVAVAVAQPDDLTRHYQKTVKNAHAPWSRRVGTGTTGGGTRNNNNNSNYCHWKVGQVLALLVDRNSNKISAVIQWLLPWSYVKYYNTQHAKTTASGSSPRLVDPDDFKNATQTMRNHFMLWAQSAGSNGDNNDDDELWLLQSVVDVTQRLPVAIQIREYKTIQPQIQRPVD